MLQLVITLYFGGNLLEMNIHLLSFTLNQQYVFLTTIASAFRLTSDKASENSSKTNFQLFQVNIYVCFNSVLLKN